MQRILDGSTEGRVKNAAERGALVNALAALCQAPGQGSDMEKLAEQTSGFLANLYKWVPSIAFIVD